MYKNMQFYIRLSFPTVFSIGNDIA